MVSLSFFCNCVFNKFRGCCDYTCLKTPLMFLLFLKAEHTVAVLVSAVGSDEKGTRVLVPVAAEFLGIRICNTAHQGHDCHPQRALSMLIPDHLPPSHTGSASRKVAVAHAACNYNMAALCHPGLTWCCGSRKLSGVTLLLALKKVTKLRLRGGAPRRSEAGGFGVAQCSQSSRG